MKYDLVYWEVFVKKRIYARRVMIFCDKRSVTATASYTGLFVLAISSSHSIPRIDILDAGALDSQGCIPFKKLFESKY